MFIDIILWFTPGPGLLITILGTICFVSVFYILVKTLRENMSSERPVPDVRGIELNMPAVGDVDKYIPDFLEYTEFISEDEFDLLKQDMHISAEHVTAVNAANERIKLMFDTAPLIIEYWDKSYNRIDYNKTAAVFYNIPITPGKPVSLADVVFGTEQQPGGIQTRNLWQNYLNEAFERGFSKFEYVSQKGGNVIHLQVNVRRMKVLDEYVVVTYTNDVSAANEIMLEKERKSIAESNSQAKSRFLAHMSHEIRTPVSAVLGIAEIQLRSKHSPEAIEAFGQIYRSSATLVGILNDILDLSKIEAGKMDLAVKSYDVAEMIQDVSQMHAVSMENKKFKFIVDVDENLPKSLLGNELRIKQIINNLLSNGFKYTDTGFVRFAVSQQIAEENGSAVSSPERVNMIITIEDTGCGMTEEQVNALLSEDYVRFNEQLDVTGTGLGISIVQNLLTLMGAKMNIESRINEGTKVTVTIPQQIVNSTTLGQQTAARLGKIEAEAPKLDEKVVSMPHGRVLVVDDMESNLFVARGLLGFYELQVDTCLDAATALEMIKNGEEYDVIFMDHMMPDIDGMEATKILRERGYTKPIVALTANALVEQEEEFLNNGFDEFMSKPIKTSQLHEVLMKYVA